MKQATLLLPIPDNCAYKGKLIDEIKAKLAGTATLDDLQLICSREKMLAQVTVTTSENLLLKAFWLIYDLIENYHPIREGEKVKIKMSVPSNMDLFRKVEIKRENNRTIAHVYAGVKGKSKKAHIFREPGTPQRVERSEKHLSPTEGFDAVGEHYHSIVDLNKDFHACVLVEVND